MIRPRQNGCVLNVLQIVVAAEVEAIDRKRSTTFIGSLERKVLTTESPIPTMLIRKFASNTTTATLECLLMAGSGDSLHCNISSAPGNKQSFFHAS